MPSSGTKCPTKMSYENVLRRFGDFCIVVEVVLCTAQRLNINPCWAVQRPLGSMFAVLWYEMSYKNVLRRFGDFCIVVGAVFCTAGCYFIRDFLRESVMFRKFPAKKYETV